MKPSLPCKECESVRYTVYIMISNESENKVGERCL